MHGGIDGGKVDFDLTRELTPKVRLPGCFRSLFRRTKDIRELNGVRDIGQDRQQPCMAELTSGDGETRDSLRRKKGLDNSRLS